MSWLHWAGKNAKTFTEGKRAQGVIVEQDREPEVDARKATEIVRSLGSSRTQLDRALDNLRSINTGTPEAKLLSEVMMKELSRCRSIMASAEVSMADLADGASSRNIIFP